MTHDDRSKDSRVADALRQLDRSRSVSASDLDALTNRIVHEASGLLAQRRAPDPAWWEYPAAWARTLIPLGALTAIIAAAILVRTIAAPPALATNSERAMSDRLLLSLVTPVEDHVSPGLPRR
ncbi:MAG TPA: hypothetical protein VE967_04625 [Gemmatimonadaceae bacterium]|nr:hypothetical protein [Gemmatimonadaceae bacterium]